VQHLIVALSMIWLGMGQAFVFLVSMLKRLPRPALKQERGMSLWHDAADWLGGYPYEYASFEEIQEFVTDLGFELRKTLTRLPATSGEEHWRRSRFTTKLFNNYAYLTHLTGNNEFVFKKNTADALQP